MSEEIMVSVVIPVYNAAPWLRQCLDSVVGQTLREIEIICVDDGSTDESPQILEEYAQADERVRILHQQNQYAGVARNNGLAHASGKYIIFWDSDDYFDLDALRLMVERAEETNADVCICNAQNFDSDTGTFLAHSYVRKPYPETDVFNIQDCKDRIYTFTSTVAWNKLVRRQFMVDEQITFQAQQHINDVQASLLILSLAKRITICNKRLVYYRMNRSGSLMSSYGEKIDSVMTAYEETWRRLEERGLTEDPQIRQSITDKAVGVYYFTMPYVDNIDQYRAYFDRMTKGDRFLKEGSRNLNSNFHMTRYLKMLDMDADSFLFSEYQRLTQEVDKKKQELDGVKRDLKKALRTQEKLQTKNDSLKEKNAELKDSLTQARREQSRLQKETDSQKKQLQLKSVRAALAASRVLGKLHH